MKEFMAINKSTGEKRRCILEDSGIYYVPPIYRGI